MALPEGFSEFEFLQSTFINVQNEIVRDEFRDLGESWEIDPDVNLGRGALAWASLIKDNDTATMVIMRLFLFYFILRKAKDLQPAIYGIPITSFKEQRKYKPQIKLYFLEDAEDVDAGYSPVDGEISFRLMNKDVNNMSMSELETIANKIKNLFAKPSFVWKKGKEMYSYTDWSKGYQLQLLCRNEAEAKKIVEQVLDIQGHTPNWAKMNQNNNLEPSESYPTVPPTETILGKRVKQARKRPVADVRFQCALFDSHELANPIVLVDRSGSYINPLVTAS